MYVAAWAPAGRLGSSRGSGSPSFLFFLSASLPLSQPSVTCAYPHPIHSGKSRDNNVNITLNIYIIEEDEINRLEFN